jgi:hypothetical protein
MCYEHEWMIWEEASARKREQAKPVPKETMTSPRPVQPASVTEKPAPVEAELEPV